MKLDANALRYITADEFRTLTAVELGQRNVRMWREVDGRVLCVGLVLLAALVHVLWSYFSGVLDYLHAHVPTQHSMRLCQCRSSNPSPSSSTLLVAGCNSDGIDGATMSSHTQAWGDLPVPQDAAAPSFGAS